jgi:hypothetical protein
LYRYNTAVDEQWIDQLLGLPPMTVGGGGRYNFNPADP